ncbi:MULTISPECIES: carbohydrate ABC transporter permease [Agathobacter]|uniref:Carbohydrate ABC transporter permease n=1 Tax=Agathobacter ruminis TaxID=1712665 RepID=A0A2G3E171_9FIRM|nr:MULTISPECIES: carbohydrate ABC transporter permease [Agathobacter]MBQ1682551.1 carbohydrate ABC transporter permease [Agathobacter sp.]MCR5678271.1 carbohydrate ABC transporter permease [Agathobacter sp.]MDC7302442.1 carbohydrate ABC transporter permease [Agathobacter ruminis]PHU36971.1 carbohydrate ABC transporter permease [Agathobacter ruminis]
MDATQSFKLKKIRKPVSFYVWSAIIYFLLVALAVICVIPFLMMLVNATRSGDEIIKGFTLIPSDQIVHNWKTVFGHFNLFRGMLNSVMIAVPATVLSIYFSTLTAFALAFYKFKGNKVIFMTILIFMMIPGQLSLIGFYQLCAKLHLIDSYLPLIIPAVASPGTVFFLRQYILASMPPSLLEAARIDGASELFSFHRIVFPIVLPAIATMGIMGFIGNWNSYLLPMILINTNEKMPLTVMMTTLNASIDITKNQGATYLCVAISVVPILLVFFSFSKYIISSVSAGAVKE